MQTENQHPTYDDDEIDLRELIRILLKQKKIITIVTVTVFLLALIYALAATPVYKATAIFLPPNENDISHLIIPEIYTPDKTKLYKEFAIALESRLIFREVFNSLNLFEYYTEKDNKNSNKIDIFDEFIKQISLKRPKAKRGEEITPNLFLSVTDQSPEMAAKMTNTIAEMANTALARETIKGINDRITLARTQLEKEIDGLRTVVDKKRFDEIERIKEKDQLQIKEINDQIIELRATAKKKRMDEIERLKEADFLAKQETEEKISSLRAIALTKREDRIRKLEEAAAVAKNAGIIERSDLLGNQQFDSEKSTIYTEINTQLQPLYLRGEKALLAEINELKNRKSDDPFIPKLRDLQEQLELLKENKKIEVLQGRKNDDPFIPELRSLQQRLDLLKNNRKIEVLLARESNDPFTTSLREKELRFEELGKIQLSPDRVRLASFDQPAFPPVNREKPKRLLIVALGLVLGLFLGIIAAFMVNFWQSIREEDLEKA